MLTLLKYTCVTKSYVHFCDFKKSELESDLENDTINTYKHDFYYWDAVKARN